MRILRQHPWRWLALSGWLMTALACSLFFPPPTEIAPPTQRPAADVPATDAPATDAPTKPAPAEPTAAQHTAVEPTAPAVEGAYFLIQAPDRTPRLLTLDGQPAPLSALPAPVYVEADLDHPQATGWYGPWAIGPQGATPLTFVSDYAQGLAGWQDSAGGQARVAWGEYTFEAGLVSQLLAAAPDGSGRRVLVEESSDESVLRALAWSPDGQRLFFSHEPIGLGGYILFAGFSSLYVYHWPDGPAETLVSYGEAGAICLGEFFQPARLVTSHCAPDQMGVMRLDNGQTEVIDPPAELAGAARVMGDGHMSPDAERMAFALARSDPENEQGWVAISSGVAGDSRVAATAAAGDFFGVHGWLDVRTVVLQSWNDPGVWLLDADSGDLRRVGDGVLLAIVPAGER